jgi:hypothetical protein
LSGSFDILGLLAFAGFLTFFILATCES